jgi:hypothetical protein
MRPTDVCHPNELRAPAPRAFPVRSRHFRSGDAPRRLRLRAVVTGGPNVSRRSKDRFGGSSFNTRPRALLPHGLETRAWAFSSHGADAIEPLTPLSRAPGSTSRLTQLPGCCNLAVRPSFGRFVWVGGCGDRQDHR